MRPSVSQFVLHPETQHPTIPSLLRSRNHTPKPIPQYESLQMKQIIIEVQNCFPQSKKNSRVKGSHVRNQIDSCLNAIDQAWKQQIEGQLTKTSKQGTPSSQHNIHRVDNRLILDYLHTVSNQYCLKQRFIRKNHLQYTPLPQQTSPKTPSYSHRRPYSVEATSKGKKQYLQLTRASKQEKRSQSVMKKQNVAIFSRPALWDNVGSIGYCLNCDQRVNLNEVNQHEQHECPRLQQIYQMSFISLVEMVNSKINRIQKQLEISIRELKQKQGGQHLYTRVVGHTIQQIEALIQKGANRDKRSFQSFNQSLENSYHTSLELTHKLHWFTRIKERLIEAQNERKKGEIRTQRMKELVVPVSPIARLENTIPKTIT